MLDRIQYLLAKISEEGGEVTQAAMKAQIFGLEDFHPKNEQVNIVGLLNEVNDLLAVTEMLVETIADDFSGLPEIGCRTAIERKKEKVTFYMGYSQDCGTLIKEQ
jgi:hypothetical protein